MAHLFQVGAGSGGMHALDAIARDPRITHVTLLDPDTYQEHNIDRHLFGRFGIGKSKVELAVEWLQHRRPELVIEALTWDLCDSAHSQEIETRVAQCDIGVCAADNEAAKFHFDALFRNNKKPWTLGEVLSGGIGGLVHRFIPGGPCYGCVSSHLKREANEAPAEPAPDYSAPGGPVEAARIPASKAAVAAIGGLHALLTLDLLETPPVDPGFTTLLLSLKRVRGVFDDPYRPFRFRVPRLPDCLICGTQTGRSPEDLDVALDEAFTRLGNG
ncbi:MAG: ThiF family adenylyltransferase [Gemmataceae bacterium]